MLNDLTSINNRYKDHIQGIILARFRLCSFIAIFLHLLFYFIDNLMYPNQSSFFLQVRTFDSFVIMIFFILSFLKPFKNKSIVFTNICSSILAAGLSVMVFLTDGSSSRYYEGANLIFLGVGFINPFFFVNNLITFICQIAFFEISMLTSPTPFNLINFSFANYFMCSTAFFVVLMCKFYREQHYKAFVRQEQLKNEEAKLALMYNSADKLAKTDELTEIPNRRYFSEIVNERIRQCEANNQHFYLILFDVDNFKGINDSYGHNFGDEALVHVAECVKNSIRANDIIGRYGGDEFILYMQQIPKDILLKRLTIIGNNIRQIKLNANNQQVSVNVSFGAAPFIPKQNITLENLIERADEQLLHVKKTHKGSIGISG